jgi:5'-methylthioadenosine phosphorylase
VTRVGVIAGTGFSAALPKSEILFVETPFGDVEVGHLREGGLDAFHVLRHGTARAPAHRVNHKANVDALARCRVDAVLAINTVGALVAGVPVPSLLVPDDYLDLRSQPLSFFDDAAVHVDVGEAYCPDLRARLVAAATREGAAARDGGVYGATDGPRLETRAEVRALATLGAHVVGMTGGPEATLARERCLCYASLCLVTNRAAGVAGAKPHAQEIALAAASLSEVATRVVRRAAAEVALPRSCACGRALDNARL